MDGVPVRFVVIEVIAAAKAVIVTQSQLSVLIVGVPEDVIVVIRGVIRLFVSVAVAARSVASDVLSTRFKANVVFTCAGVRDAHADATDTRKLSVVAVSPAIVVRFEFKT